MTFFKWCIDLLIPLRVSARALASSTCRTEAGIVLLLIQRRHRRLCDIFQPCLLCVEDLDSSAWYTHAHTRTFLSFSFRLFKPFGGFFFLQLKKTNVQNTLQRRTVINGLRDVHSGNQRSISSPFTIITPPFIINGCCSVTWYLSRTLPLTLTPAYETWTLSLDTI